MDALTLGYVIGYGAIGLFCLFAFGYILSIIVALLQSYNPLNHWTEL